MLRGLVILLTKPPLIMCLLLILISATIRGAYAIVLSKWLCYSVILIFLGGIIVVFLYVRTMSLRIKISLPSGKPEALALATLIMRGSTLFVRAFTDLAFLNFENVTRQAFGLSNLSVVILLVCFLLAALFGVVRLAQGFKGAILKSW